MRTAIQSALTAAVIAFASATLVACVTINVYFPEAAAERAADRFIQDVIGDAEPAESAAISPGRAISGALARLGDWIVPSAQAQSADLDIENPQVDAIKQRMAQRHREHLAAWYEAGAIGLGSDGLIEVRDRSAVSLSARRQLEQVVSAENADRRAVYREIAVANGHPE